MGQLGDDFAKALLPVANQPLIAHHLATLHAFGVRKVFVVVGHRAADIVRMFGDGSRFAVDISYVEQPSSLGSAHALGLLRPHIDEPFLLVLGDYFFSTPDPLALVRHLTEKGTAAILVKREPDRRLICESCEVRVDEEGRVFDIVEKPRSPVGELKGCGFYAFQPDIFEAVARTPKTALRDEYELTTTLGTFIASGGRLYAEELPIAWDTNVTRPEDLLECNMEWLRHRGLDRLVAEDADLGRYGRLERVIVGSGASIGDHAVVREAVVFGGTSLEGSSSLQRVLATPQRVYRLS